MAKNLATVAALIALNACGGSDLTYEPLDDAAPEDAPFVWQADADLCPLSETGADQGCKCRCHAPPATTKSRPCTRPRVDQIR